MKLTKVPQNKFDWKVFKLCHREDTLNLVLSIESKKISEEDFTKSYIKLSKPDRSPSKGKHLYRFLVKMNYFKI